MKIINHDVNGLQINQRHDDGYINLTQMAHANNKDLHDYLRLKTTKAFIQELSLETGIHGSKIIQVKKGRGNRVQQGTWGHPQVAIHCGQWCSAKFAVLVSNWVMEWMTTGQNPITSQATATEIPIDPNATIQDLENLIISIRSHSRIMHLGSHQPVDKTLFKSLHTLSHNQLSVINAAIEHLQLLKSIAEDNLQDEPTPQQTINQLFALTPAKPSTTKPKEQPKNPTKERLATINIKISQSQRDWLAQTAKQIRQNNTKPVPAAERVYPQHLIGIAIQLLRESQIDILAAQKLYLNRQEATATINIKISRQQQEWLTTTAKTIRDNYPQPTTPKERIYPQHLVSIGVVMLQKLGLDWQQIASIADMQKELLASPVYLF